MVILPDFKGRYHSTVFNEYFFCRHRKKGEPEGPDYFNMCILIGVLLFCPALLFPAFVTGFSQRFYSLGQRKQFRYFFFDFGNGLRSFYHHVRGRPHSPEKNDRYRFTQFVDLFRCGLFLPDLSSADFAQCCQRFSIIRSHIRIHGLHCGRGIVPQQRENHGPVYRRKRIGRYGRTSHFILDRSPLHLADRIGQHRFDLRLIRHTVLTVQPPLHQLYAPQGKLSYPHHSKSPTDHLKSIDPFLPDRRIDPGGVYTITWDSI